ncbi:hypothetical protein [Campylobacter troglodytis]|uniref:hypothetical protein n=1 Tax=Campylobacter troglodytis TaxID=654363 RepID=UPI00115BD756|nr:hypothetical protein [Campylobacter troglodytis]
MKKLEFMAKCLDSVNFSPCCASAFLLGKNRYAPTVKLTLPFHNDCPFPTTPQGRGLCLRLKMTR